jgi:hypothetical protein
MPHANSKQNGRLQLQNATNTSSKQNGRLQNAANSTENMHSQKSKKQK